MKTIFSWPRGKWNGKRIVGIKISIRFDLLYWSIGMGWNFWMPYLNVGPLHFRFEVAYDYKED